MERDLTMQNPELLQGQALQQNYDEMTGVVNPVEQGAEVAEGRTFQEEAEMEERGVFARIGAKIGEVARERMPRKLTAGLAVAAIAVSGAVETSNQNTEKAEAATTTRTLGPNALKKLCVQAGLKMPQLPANYLLRQNEKRLGYQDWWLSERNYLVPAVCNGKYKRVMSMRREVQNPIQPKRWHKAEASQVKWYPIMSGNTGIGNKNDPNYSDDKYTASQSLLVGLDAPKSMLYRCAPGSRKTRARVKIRNQVKDLETGKFVRAKVKKYPIKVLPAC